MCFPYTLWYYASQFCRNEEIAHPDMQIRRCHTIVEAMRKWGQVIYKWFKWIRSRLLTCNHQSRSLSIKSCDMSHLIDTISKARRGVWSKTVLHRCRDVVFSRKDNNKQLQTVKQNAVCLLSTVGLFAVLPITNVFPNTLERERGEKSPIIWQLANTKGITTDISDEKCFGKQEEDWHCLGN